MKLIIKKTNLFLQTLRKYFYIVTILSLFLLLSPFGLLAEDELQITDEDLKAIEELAEVTKQEMDLVNLYVTTAGRRPQKLRNAPSSMSVITSEDIRQSGAVQLSDALMMIPGVDMGYTTTTYPLAGGIRGFHKLPANKVLLLIDGNPWAFDVYGVPKLHYLPISLDDIDRIEVLKGPGSSLYGANAMFGVINIITKKTKDYQGFQFSSAGGEWNTFAANARYAGITTDRFSYTVSAGFNTMDNPDYVAWQSNPNMRYWRVNTNIEYSLNENSSIYASGGYISVNQLETLQESTGPLDWSGHNTYLASVTYQSQLPSIKVSGYIKDSNKNDGWALGEKDLAFSEGVKSFDFQHDFEPFKNDKLVWGGNFTNQYCDGESINDMRSHNLYGAFFDNTYTMINSDSHEFAINGGLRYDHHPNTGGSVSHRLSLMYSLLEKHNFRLTWGSSYRNPDFIEFYYSRFSLYKKGNLNAPDVYLHVYGQKENNPEKAMTYEFAYNLQLSSKYTFSTCLFYSKIKDFVYFVAEPNNLYIDNKLQSAVIPMPFKNIGDARQYGAEGELRIQLTDYLNWRINYTWYDQKEDQEIVKQLLVMTPTQMANTQLRLKLKNGFSANLSAHFRDSTEWREYTWKNPERDTHAGGKTPSYVIANVRIGYQFDLGKNQIDIALAAFNILNKRYDDYPIDTSDISRRITAFFSMNF
ncbi:MAG: TonB-dependent receptor [Desulfobacterales bacterium]|nr:TonB-dependent receptor [Desulfobacterales bacterium]